MYRSLKLLKMIAGDNHPEIGSIYLNLGLMYQEVDMNPDAIDCYQNNLKQNVNMVGEMHIQTASSY